MKRFTQLLRRSIAKYTLLLHPKNATSFRPPPILHINLQIPQRSPTPIITSKRKYIPFHPTPPHHFQQHNIPRPEPFLGKISPQHQKMPMPNPSFLYNESPTPSLSPLPLQARKVYFCSPPNHHPLWLGPEPLPHRWTFYSSEHDAGIRIFSPIYVFRHDMIDKGRCAITHEEKWVERCVQKLVGRGGRREGW